MNEFSRDYARSNSHQRNGSDHGRDHSRNYSYDKNLDNSRNLDARNPVEKTKEIITGAQSTLDCMKRELADKNRLIEQKNREIVQLRMQNDEFKSNFEKVDSLVVS